MSTHPVPHATERFVPIADVAKTLGNPQRLTLLEHLVKGEQSVEKLAELSGLTIANTSQHLQHLRRAGFVAARRSGKHMLYRLGDGPLAPVLAALKGFVDFQQDLVRQVVADSRDPTVHLEGVSVQELLRRLADGSVILLDVRPDAEFSSAHVPGAISIPVHELAQRLADIPGDFPVIAYCRDPYCVLSVEAVAILRSSGRDAERLAGGISQWIAAGQRVDVTR
ncbi:metalloregulator ArsR/SmtB family transcription factor [Pseudomonas sp. NBRC 111139]|uniref:ArsR/SmtB family transcription factor n=1 Tax=Pseudomonas sp. NBRC 111139 TaxID=1661054 RepID=UPI000AF87B46|nr:metalloregulator ArsR/SmtB family transcription factor [Pseudomonas sp. NBRC 111139]